MSILTDISENLQRGKAKIVKELVQQAIDEGIPVQQILDEGLLSGMGVIGEKFKNNEVFVPEVLVAARAMNAGAALLKHFVQSFGPMPTLTVERIGIGTGQKDFPQANLLRAFWCSSAVDAPTAPRQIAELRCTLDDMTGEDLGFAVQLLLDAGALDVYTLPIQMKKNRPGIILCVT